MDNISVVPRDSWLTAAPHFFGLEAAKEAHERGAWGVGAGTRVAVDWECVTGGAGAATGVGTELVAFVAGAGAGADADAGVGVGSLAVGVGTGESSTGATTTAGFSGSGVWIPLG